MKAAWSEEKIFYYIFLVSVLSIFNADYNQTCSLQEDFVYIF